MKSTYKSIYFFVCLIIAVLMTQNTSAQVIIDKVTDTVAVVGEVYAYQVTAVSSPDNETYTLEVEPEAGMNITTSGLITWTPSSTIKGGKVVVRATNSEMETATREFFIYVAKGVTCPSYLAAYWKMDETVSPYVDYAANNNAVISSGGLLKDTVGVLGRAQVFNSANDNMLSVPVSDTFNWNTNDEFTIEFWFNNKINDLSVNQVMIGRNDGTMHWWLGMNDGENLTWYIRPSSGADIEATHPHSAGANAWYHALATRDASDSEVLLYVNGVAGTPVTYNGTNLSSGVLDLTIGWLNNEQPEFSKYQYDGRIDEIAIYNKVLNSTEIDARYNGGTPTPVCPYSNFAPIFRSTPLTSIIEEEAYNYTFVLSDFDGGAMTYDVVTKPSWLTYTSLTRLLSGTPTDGDVGTFPVKIKVVNTGTTDTVFQEFSITVNNVNDKPVISNLETAALAYNEDDGPVAISSALTVTDVDDTNLDSARVWISTNYVNGEDELAFTNTTITGVWNAATGSLKLTGTATKADYQAAIRSITYENTNVASPSVLTRTISITANDGGLNSTTVTRTITVASVNDCPDVENHLSISTPEDDTILIKLNYLTVTDIDDIQNNLSLTVAAGTNYTYSGNIVTPALNFSGVLNVNVVVTDTKCNTDYILPVTITPVNDAPVFNFSTIPLNAYEQQTYLLKIRAYDPDQGDILLYTVPQKPAWLNVISDTILTGVPDFGDIGSEEITITVSDGEIPTDTTFTLVVNPTNDIPHITSTPETTATLNELYTYNIEVADTNVNDPLIITAPILPGWLSLDDDLLVLTGTPTAGDLATPTVNFTVQLKVSDGKQDSTQTFIITATRPSGIASKDFKNARVFPNPANEYLVFEINDGNEIFTVEIFDITGKSVYNNNKYQNSQVIEIGDLNIPDGFYLFKITSADTYVGNVIIRR